MQRTRTARRSDFENIFPNGQLERPVYVEMSAHVLSDRNMARACLDNGGVSTV